MCAESKLVAHCAGEDEEGCFVGGELSKMGLKVIGRGVFGENVVKEGCVLDCGEHMGCRCRHDVAYLLSVLNQKNRGKAKTYCGSRRQRGQVQTRHFALRESRPLEADLWSRLGLSY